MHMMVITKKNKSNPSDIDWNINEFVSVVFKVCHVYVRKNKKTIVVVNAHEDYNNWT